MSSNANAKHELRFTETNSADEASASRGAGGSSIMRATLNRYPFSEQKIL